MTITQNIPVISIGIVSHNHQDFIARAIQSVLNQKHSYPYELIIFDDASDDKTPEIINDFHHNYPEIIKPFLLKNNVGPIAVAQKLASEMQGKYCAWLDADDYWTYSNKLNLQIAFLETHADYTGCFHDALIRSSVTSEPLAGEIAIKQSHEKYRYYSQFNLYSPEFLPLHLLSRNIIPTASLVFRNRDFSLFFKSYTLPVYSFSWALQLYIIKDSKFYYFNRCWSVYLDHAQGLSKKLASESFSLNNVRILKWIKRDNYYKRFKNRIHFSIAKEYECVLYSDKKSKFNKRIGFKSQINYFKGWWYTAWYYFLEASKQLFKKNSNLKIR